MGKAQSFWKISLLGVSITALLTGCGTSYQNNKPNINTNTISSNSSTTGAASSAKVENITFWDMEWGGPTYIQEAQTLVNQFNKENPDIHVTYQSIPWNNWYQTFATALASGTGPDVSSGAGYQPFQFADAGDILNLAPVISDWKKSGVIKQYSSQSIQAEQYKGMQVAIPWNLDVRILFYNKSLFSKHHLTPPKNWDQLYKDAVALTGNGKYGIGFAEGNNALQSLLFFIMDNGGGLFTKDGKLNFLSNQKNTQTINFLQKLAKAKTIDPAGPGWTNSSQPASAFAQGQIAMMVGEPSSLSDIPANMQKNVGVVPLPSSSNGSKGTIYWINGLMAYKQSKYPAADYKFLEWWSANMGKLLQSGDLIPANTRLQNAKFYQSNTVFKDALKQYIPYAKTTANYDPNLFPQLNAIEGNSALSDLVTKITENQPLQPAEQQANSTLQSLMSGN